MKFYSIFLAILCITAFTANGATIQQNLKALDGRIILIQGHQYDGSYVDARAGGSGNCTARVTTIGENDLRDPSKAKRYKFIVHWLGDDLVAFESLDKRDYYIDMYSWDHLGITKHNTNPTDASCPKWMQHRIADLSPNGDMTECTLRDVRWKGDRYWDSHWTGKLAATYCNGNPSPSQKWGRWTIKFPQAIDVKNSSYDICNSTPEEVTYQVSKTVGITKMLSNTQSTTTTMSYEMSVNIPFVSMMDAGGITNGAKVSSSQTFSHTDSHTFQESTTTSTTVKVPAGRHYRIVTTHATYGGVNGFTISNQDFHPIDIGPVESGSGCPTSTSAIISLP